MKHNDANNMYHDTNVSTINVVRKQNIEDTKKNTENVASDIQGRLSPHQLSSPAKGESSRAGTANVDEKRPIWKYRSFATTSNNKI